VFSCLLTFPNVLITWHHAFFTPGAMERTTDTTPANIAALEAGDVLGNEVTVATVQA
jgi:phosphoglycerate dehydrogenase-like enzyme